MSCILGAYKNKQFPDKNESLTFSSKVKIIFAKNESASFRWKFGRLEIHSKMYQCVDVNKYHTTCPTYTGRIVFIPKKPVGEVLDRVQTRFLFRISKKSLFAKAISFHHISWFTWQNYFLFVISIRKVWSVVFMVVVSMLPNAEIGRNDYQEGTPHFNEAAFYSGFSLRNYNTYWN